MFYRTVYPKAWQITRKNPVVWFFGLFAALLGYYEIETLSGLANNFPDFISTNIKSWVDIFVTFSNANLTWSSLPDVLALFGLFILFSAITILAISSQASLTYTASAKGKQSVKKSLGLQLQNGVDKFASASHRKSARQKHHEHRNGHQTPDAPGANNIDLPEPCRPASCQARPR